MHLSVYLKDFRCQIVYVASPGSLRFINVSLLWVQETWSSQVHGKLQTWRDKILDIAILIDEKAACGMERYLVWDRGGLNSAPGFADS